MRSLLVLVWLALLGTVAVADDRHRPYSPSWAAPQLLVTPDTGPPGTVVAIRGMEFHGFVSVSYGDQRMQLVRASRHEIVAMIPPNVRGADYIYVVDQTGRARTVLPFRVDRGWRPPVPQFDRDHLGMQLVLEPMYGAPGAQVHIYGRFGAYARPFYGSRPMLVFQRAPGYLLVQVPPMARRNRYISVIDGPRRFTSRHVFQLQLPFFLPRPVL